MATGRLVYDGDNRYTEKEARVHKLKEEVEQKIDNIPWVIDDVTSDSATDALSAHMGKVLQDQITNMSGLNKFLSTWDCTEGLPTTDPAVSPYLYEAWNYYIVSKVAEEWGTNMKPHGRSYVSWMPSTEIETWNVAVNDWYIYDGSQWVLQEMSPKEIAIDEWLSPTSRNPVENRAVYSALTTKQNSILDLNTIREGAALWATSVQPWDNIDTLNNNMHYQTLGDVTTLINEAVIGGLTPDINTKTFYLSSTSDLVTGQAIYEWKAAWKNAIIVLDWKSYFRDHITNLYPNRWICYEQIEDENVQVAWINWHMTYSAFPSLTFTVEATPGMLWSYTVTDIQAGRLYGYQFLQPGINYTTAYMPEYDGSPATKKYVDDSIEATKASWSTAPVDPEPGTIWYNTTNNNTYIYNGTDWEEVVTNTKTMFLTWVALTDASKAQEIYDWVRDWKNIILVAPDASWDKDTFFFDKDNEPAAWTTTWSLSFLSIDNEWIDWASTSEQTKREALIDYDWTTATWIRYVATGTGETYIRTDVDYQTPYTPTYDGSPATKKYVDDSIEHASSSWEVAPTNPEPGNTWYDTTNNILKVWDWTKWVSLQELLVSGTNIKTVNGQNILWSGDLSTWEIVFVTAQEYTDLPAEKETNGKVYFIYE